MIHFPSGMSVPVFSQHADWRFLPVWMCCFCRLSDPAFFKFIPSTQQSPVNFREGRKLWSITILKKKEVPEKDTEAVLRPYWYSGISVSQSGTGRWFGKRKAFSGAAPHAVYPRLYADRAVFDHDYHLYHCGNSAGGLRHEFPG